MRFLSARLHGYLDIVFIVLFVVGPIAFGLGGTPALISFVLAALLLILTLVTNYPMGVVKRIAFFAHGLVELAMTIFMALLPRLDGYSPGSPARRFYWMAAVALAIVWLLTDYRHESERAIPLVVKPSPRSR